MDIKAEPRSDQLNADDLLSGPITVTIKTVTPGKAEQPYDFELIEYPGRSYRPNKSMLRVIIDAWGSDASVFAGRRMTLYRDPDVKFGPDAVGGIRISHLSHISGSRKVALTVTRGKRKPYTVQPLIGFDNEAWKTKIAAAASLPALRAIWNQIVEAGSSTDRELIALKDTRKLELDVETPI